MSLAVELRPGAWLHLLPQRAAYDPALQCLLVADAHLGKAASFRRLGVPVPEATTADALQRIDASITATGARQVVFLGDLWHGPLTKVAATVAAVAHWRRGHPGLAMTLVRGNHDARAGEAPADLAVEACDAPLRLGPWALVHEPQAVDGAYTLAGHVHPGVVLGGRAADRLRLPCFRFDEKIGLLPAFGDFTGLHVPRRQRGERVFAIVGELVQEV